MFEASGPVVSSVAELLNLLSTKDESLLTSGVSALLQSEESIVPLVKYCRSEPDVPQVISLLAVILQSSNHEMMGQILRLICSSLRILLANHPTAAFQMARGILNERLRPIYRCLSTGHLVCLAAACELLEEFCLDGATASLMVAVLDFSHPGFVSAAKQRKPSDASLGVGSSPRTHYTSWVLRLLRTADYDTRVNLSRHPTILHLILNGLFADSAASVSSVLKVVQERLVFNEEENRNLAVAFLRAHQLPTVGSLLTHRDAAKRNAAREFLSSCFAVPGKGLCYPVEVYHSLRNRLLADLILDLNIRDDEPVQEMAVELMRACPDVAWHYICSGRTSFDMNNVLSFSISVSLTIKLLGICGNATMAVISRGVESLCPSSINRTLLTRGICHEDNSIRFNALLLILALLQRVEMPLEDVHILSLRGLMPDFRTVYNAWHHLVGGEEDELSPMIAQCCLEVVHEYLRLGLHDKDLYSYLKVRDIWSEGERKECSECAVRICKVLDPVPLLASAECVAIVHDLCLRATEEADVHGLLTDWIMSARIVGGEDGLLASALARDSNVQEKILRAIHDIYQKPLLYPAGTRPLCQYLGLTEESHIESLIKEEGEKKRLEELEQQKMREANLQETIEPAHTVDEPKAKRNKLAVDLELAEKSLMGVTNAASCLYALLGQGMAKRSAIMDSFSSISPRTSLGQPPAGHDIKQLMNELLNNYNFTAWLALMATVMNDEEQAYQIDLRLLVESGIMGYPIIGLSLEDETLRRTSHLILCRFAAMMSVSRIREKRQINLLLNSLAGQSSPQDPLLPLPRLLAYFYAEALPLMLRPEHPLYRPLNEILLLEPFPSAPTIFSRLYADTNEEWEQELGWALGWTDRALGRGGEFAKDCDVEAMHLVENASMLLLMGNDKDGWDGIKKAATRILKKCSPTWLPTFISLHQTADMDDPQNKSQGVPPLATKATQ